MANKLWEQEWLDTLDLSRKKPELFLGDLKIAHKWPILDIAYLVYKNYAFRDPSKITVHLSPRQYLVSVESGSLQPSIEEGINWRGTYILADEWSDLNEKLLEKHSDKDSPEWKNAFNNPVGTRLSRLAAPSAFAHSLIYCIKTKAGLRCQAFQEGWPERGAYILPSSQTGIFAAASLNSKWFTGLPFNNTDIDNYLKIPNIEMTWHECDDIIDNNGSISELLEQYEQ